MQRDTLAIADRLGDNRSKAYALSNEILVSTLVTPKPLDEFEILKRGAIRAAAHSDDVHIKNWTGVAIGWDLLHRGRIDGGREAAREFMRVGGTLNDPRSTGLGLAILTWIALVSDAYTEALESRV
jgi:hypothetical protein